jgi:hypothetical protein
VVIAGTLRNAEHRISIRLVLTAILPTRVLVLPTSRNSKVLPAVHPGVTRDSLASPSRSPHLVAGTSLSSRQGLLHLPLGGSSADSVTVSRFRPSHRAFR